MNNNIQSAEPQKLWFGARWTKSLLDFVDSILFYRDCKKEELQEASIAPSFFYSFLSALCCGTVCVVGSLFMDQETVMNVCFWGACGISAIFSILFLVKNLKLQNSVLVKILRAIYVVIVNLIGTTCAFFLGSILGFIAVVVVLFWFVLKVIFPDDNKKKYITKDGTEIEVTKGICGEEYYSDGTNQYEKEGDTFIKK